MIPSPVGTDLRQVTSCNIRCSFSVAADGIGIVVCLDIRATAAESRAENPNFAQATKRKSTHIIFDCGKTLALGIVDTLCSTAGASLPTTADDVQDGCPGQHDTPPGAEKHPRAQRSYRATKSSVKG